MASSPVMEAALTGNRTGASGGPSLRASSTRTALSVFFLTGLIMAFPGAILPAWGYHLKYDFMEVGHYFLAMIAGLLVAARLGGHLIQRRDVRFAVVTGCVIACLGFLELAFTPPPLHWGWRVVGMALVGIAAGLLNTAAFQSVSSVYERDPASTVNIAGAAFGIGCLAVALMISAAFYIYTVTSTLILLAAIPGFAAGIYARSDFAAPVAHQKKTWKDVWVEVQSPGAILFTLLLFFQFANEWSVAGWLPIFLVHRVGVSPDTSLGLLAFYWLALLLGRVLTQSLLPVVGHGKLLLGSILSALLGAIILSSTNNNFGSWLAILFLGGGFATIYPLVVEKIGHRFPNYHPGFYNGLLSFGLTGGLLAPWCLGYLANWWGIGMVMVVPLLGTLMVFLLVILLWVETRLASPR